MKINFLYFFAYSLFSSALIAGDWPGWRGENRDDISDEKGLLKSWPSSGPDKIWMNEDGGRDTPDFRYQMAVYIQWVPLVILKSFWLLMPLLVRRFGNCQSVICLRMAGEMDHEQPLRFPMEKYTHLAEKEILFVRIRGQVKRFGNSFG